MHEMDSDEFTTDQFRSKSKRRSSILRVRQPLSELDDDYENKTKRKLRRVSFSENTEVREFRAQACHLFDPPPELVGANSEVTDANNFLDILSSFPKKTTKAVPPRTTTLPECSVDTNISDDHQAINSAADGNRTIICDDSDMDMTDCMPADIRLNATLSAWNVPRPYIPPGVVESIEPGTDSEDKLLPPKDHAKGFISNERNFPADRTVTYDDDNMDMTQCLTGVVMMNTQMASKILCHGDASGVNETIVFNNSASDKISLLEDSQSECAQSKPFRKDFEGHKTIYDDVSMDVTLGETLKENSCRISTMDMILRETLKEDSCKILANVPSSSTGSRMNQTVLFDGNSDLSFTECAGKFLATDSLWRNLEQTRIFTNLEQGAEVEETECIRPVLRQLETVDCTFVERNLEETPTLSESTSTSLKEPVSLRLKLSKQGKNCFPSQTIPEHEGTSNRLSCCEPFVGRTFERNLVEAPALSKSMFASVDEPAVSLSFGSKLSEQNKKRCPPQTIAEHESMSNRLSCYEPFGTGAGIPYQRHGNAKPGTSDVALGCTSGVASVGDKTGKLTMEKNQKGADDSISGILSSSMPEDCSVSMSDDLPPVLNSTSAETSARNNVHRDALSHSVAAEIVTGREIRRDRSFFNKTAGTDLTIPADFCISTLADVSTIGNSHLSHFTDIGGVSDVARSFAERYQGDLTEYDVTCKLPSSDLEDFVTLIREGLSKPPELEAEKCVSAEPPAQNASDVIRCESFDFVGATDAFKAGNRSTEKIDGDFTEDIFAEKPPAFESEEIVVEPAEKHSLSIADEASKATSVEVSIRVGHNQDSIRDAQMVESAQLSSLSSEHKAESVRMISFNPAVEASEEDTDVLRNTTQQMLLTTSVTVSEPRELNNHSVIEDDCYANDEFRRIDEEAAFISRVKKELMTTLLESLTHYLMEFADRRIEDRFTEWSVEEWNDSCCKITFLSRTLALDVDFGGNVEEFEFCGRPARKIKTITLTSFIGGEIWPECTLAHRLLYEAVDASHLRCFKDTSQFDKIVHHILVCIFQAECVKKAITQLDPNHFGHLVTINGHRLGAEFIFPAAFVRFTISCDVHLPRLHFLCPDWQVAVHVGSVKSRDILDQIQKVKPGFHYLGDVFSQIKSWLHTLPPSNLFC